MRVVAIAGNHDGPERVAAYDGLTDLSGVIVRGGFARAGAVTTLELDDGPLDVVAVPYLDPVLTPPGWADGAEGVGAPAMTAAAHPPRRSAPSADPDGPLSLFDLLVDDEPPVAPSPPAAPSRRTHHGVLDQALRRARAERRAPRGIVVAHAFVSGAVASESERLLTVGGTAEVGVELFSGFDYVALGHLHRPQRVAAGVDTVRYSGTPLPYSFSETHPKQVVLVDMATDGTTEVRTVEVPLGRRVATLTGTLDELLADPSTTAVADAFVRAVVTDRGYVVDAEVGSRPGSRSWSRSSCSPSAPKARVPPARPAPLRQRLAPLEAAVGFWRDVTGEEPEQAERSLLESALAHVASAEAGA